MVIEHADRAPERALFHLYNLMRERGGWLLLISENPPAHWRIALPDLASRLRAAPTVAVAPPDDELLGSIILKQLADRQLHAGAGVVHYLVQRMERSADAARHIVAALDRRALAERREIDRRLAADVLTELESRGSETMDLGIKGRKAIVCAASKGLGKGCAMALAEEGRRAGDQRAHRQRTRSHGGGNPQEDRCESDRCRGRRDDGRGTQEGAGRLPAARHRDQ